MKVLAYGLPGYASRWNPVLATPAEVIVWFEDGSADSVPITEIDPVVGTRDDLRAELNALEA